MLSLMPWPPGSHMFIQMALRPSLGQCHGPWHPHAHPYSRVAMFSPMPRHLAPTCSSTHPYDHAHPNAMAPGTHMAQRALATAETSGDTESSERATDRGGYVTGEVDIGVFSSWKCRGLLVVLSDISLVFKNSLIVAGFGLKAGGHQRAASQI